MSQSKDLGTLIDSRRDEIVALASSLIRIESTTGSEGPVQSAIADFFRGIGLEVDVFEPDLAALATHPAYHPVEGLNFAGRPNVVARWRGQGGGRSLVLNGHIDTIPIGSIDQWGSEPFSGEVKDGRLLGRGTSDMKGGVAVMMMAVKILHDAGIRLRGDVILQSVVDEELTGYGTLATILRGYSGDAGICLETSDLCVQPACVGRLWFTVKLTTRPSSLTRHFESADVIENGCRIVDAFKAIERDRWRDIRHPLYPDNRLGLPCGVFMFRSGDFPSAVPDAAELRGSLGLLPHENVEDVKRSILACVDRVAKEHKFPNAPVVLFKDVGADGAEIPVDHPIVQLVASAAEDILGRAPEISGRLGGADTRYLIKYGFTPTVIFGPGLSSEMHSVNESVPVENLIVATKVIAASMVEWCGEAPDA